MVVLKTNKVACQKSFIVLSKYCLNCSNIGKMEELNQRVLGFSSLKFIDVPLASFNEKFKYDSLFIMKLGALSLTALVV